MAGRREDVGDYFRPDGEGRPVLLAVGMTKVRLAVRMLPLSVSARRTRRL